MRRFTIPEAEMCEVLSSRKRLSDQQSLDLAFVAEVERLTGFIE